MHKLIILVIKTSNPMTGAVEFQKPRNLHFFTPCNAPSAAISLLTSSCLSSASSPSESPPSLAAPPDLSVSPSAAAGCDDQVSRMGRHSQRGVVTASHTADSDASAHDGDADGDVGDFGAEDGGDDDSTAGADADGGDSGAEEDGADGCKADGPGPIGGGGRTRHAEGKGT
ncbi:unnamed protein product [Closterium sp. NIES-65]|nr:unnamed protein product [Closterium sp. NIES-65]